MREDDICKILKIEMSYEYKDDKYKVGTWNESNNLGDKSNSAVSVIISKALCIYLKWVHNSTSFSFSSSVFLLTFF